MHPAASVILFTTSTGFGYGLLVWLAWLNLSHHTTSSEFANLNIISIMIALILITSGLFSSMAHLGHPERAWRAMSQWRTSWLSREGVFAILVYPFALLWLASIYFKMMSELINILALLTALLSLITVYCTAMIYASLKPIPAWHNKWAIFGYLIYSLSTGGILFATIGAILEIGISHYWYYPLLGILLLALAIKIAYWNYIKNSASTTNQNTAIGMGGKIKQLDPPHSSVNYLMKEMGFQIARKNVNILKPIALTLAYLLPIMVLLFTNPMYLNYTILLPTLIATALGIICERYLFFAEAKHVVTNYYQ